LLRRTYNQPFPLDEVRKRLKAHSSFVLKKQDVNEEIWVYTSARQEFLLSALDNALLEINEVAGEVLLLEDALVIEAFAVQADEIADALYCSELVKEQAIQTLASTNSRLTKGTIFITSEPTLSPKLLQWAVQTYFAEKWLTSEQPELGGMEPILIATGVTDRRRESGRPGSGTLHAPRRASSALGASKPFVTSREFIGKTVDRRASGKRLYRAAAAFGRHYCLRKRDDRWQVRSNREEV
jgi:hypothetical protein